MRWRFILATVFIAISTLLTKWPESWQPFLEVVYGEHFYPYLTSFLTQLPVPKRFALMDALWLLVPVLLCIRIWWLARKNLIKRALIITGEILLWASSSYLLFMLMWGMNYHRDPLYNQLKTQGFTTNLVAGHWDFALDETIKTLNQLPDDFDFCAQQPEYIASSRPSAFAHSAMSLANIPTTQSRDVKPSFMSPIYTRIGIAGVYIPFTGEPTISNTIFPLSKPFVMTHEFGHWVGFAHEYDADILAYWSLWLSPDPVWQYSAWLEWWMDVDAPREYYNKMPQTLKDGITCYVDHLNSQPRWEIRKYFWQAYEANLKNQGISEGLKSYNMGEAMALSSYQDWLYKKRNRSINN